MAIITISRGSYSRGKEIAEKVCKKLGYDCIGRDTLIAASEQFNIPEIKLIRAIHDAPSILERFGYGKDKYVAYIQAALLRYVKKDNVIYHGLAGHFFLEDISHVLKVRISSDMEDRIVLEMEREKISRGEARRILKNDDEQRRKWSKHLYGIDTTTTSLYDLVLHIKTLTANDAVDIICHAAGLPHFQTTAQSQKALEDRLLASEVKAVLVDIKPDIEVSAKDGVVLVRAKSKFSQEEHLVHNIRELGKSVPGVKEISINVHPRQDMD
ncbi:AAA family ATPase [Chloroflexota bacterium]